MSNNYKTEFEPSINKLIKAIPVRMENAVSDTLDYIGILAVRSFKGRGSGRNDSKHLRIRSGATAKALQGGSGSIRQVGFRNGKIFGVIGVELRPFNYPYFHEFIGNPFPRPFLNPAVEKSERVFMENIAKEWARL